MHKAVSRFERDLRKIVRRAAWRKNFDAKIEEIVQHFQDLYLEALAANQSEAEAEKLARRRIGKVTTIALQIVQTPEQTEIGRRIQIACIGLFILLPASYLFSVLITDNPQWIENLPLVTNVIKVLFAGSGMLFGLGMLMARRCLWKPLVFAAAFLFIAGGFGITAGSQPERYFHMTQPEARALLARQERIDPALKRAEATMTSVAINHFKTEDLVQVGNVLEAAHLPNFDIPAKTSAGYLYPTQIDWSPTQSNWKGNEPFSYRIKFERSADAKAAIQKWSEHSRTIDVMVQMRAQNLESYRGYVAMKKPEWTLGFPLSGIFTLFCGGVYLLLATIGYLLVRLQMFRLDWFRLQRGR